MTHKKTFIFALLFFLSGASSLILEVMWQRKLVLVFGASAYATTAILTAFFIGLALGSLIGGRVLSKYKKPVEFYAFCELLIAISALLFPLLLKFSSSLYFNLFDGAENYSQRFFYQKFLLTILTILPATTAMGATIPAINKIINQQITSIGNSVSIAYGFNTLGAVAGTLISGLVLLPKLGIANTLYIAIGISLTAALGAYAMSQWFGKKAINRPAVQETRLKSHAFYVLVYFFLGFIALSYQIVWLRMMAIFGSNSVITFISTLSVYLVGFAFGSVLLFPQLSKRIGSQKIFLLSIVGLSISVLALFPLYYQFYGITVSFRNMEQTRFLLFKLEMIIAAIIMLVPTMMMSLSFPAICDITSDSNSLAKNSGFLYFIGNLGSALGVSVFGLYIVHSVGLTHALFFLVNLGFVISIFTIVKLKFSSELYKGLFVAFMFGGIFLSTFYARSALPFLRTSKVVLKNGQWSQMNTKGEITRKIVRYKTGKSATVMVKEKPDGWRGISIDDQLVASTRPDALVDSKMLAHLPLLLHPEPKNALTVGFGSGGTSWSLALHDIDAWAVEIEEEVIRSASYFTVQNHNILDQKNFHLVLDDARNFLQVTSKKFDVISTDVTNIQYKQNASLYTKEYFELMKSRLTQEGVACAWIPMVGISMEDFKILLNTFEEVYPHATLWIFDHMSTYYGVLIGTPKELRVTKKRMREFFANPRIVKDLEKIKITKPEQFKGFLHLEETGYDQFIQSTSAIHTDDMPILEFSSPQNFYSSFQDFTNKMKGMAQFEAKNPQQYFD